MKLKLLLLFFVFFAIAASGIFAAVHYGYLHLSTKSVEAKTDYKTSEESDVYVRFVMEAFDSIRANYWMKSDQYDLPKYFELSLQKVGVTSAALPVDTRDGTATMLAAAFKSASTTEAKKNIATQTLMVVLLNLQPIQRNGLLSHTEEVALRQTVSNVNPNKDLYADLGIPKDAAPAVVESTYKEKSTALSASSSPAAKEELKKVAYAHEVLAAPATKQRYDQNKIEPTVFHHVFGSTLYLYFEKMSPTTLQEFAEAIDAASTTRGLDSIVFDVRGNIGGAVDFLLGFMGLFIGQNQYVFDVFHQGIYDPQRTTVGTFAELSRYKEMAVIPDSMTQSTAELMTAALKRYHLAHVVGDKTRGWGSIENTYPIKTTLDASTTYSLLLVNSLTLRDDNQPIEGSGVVPDVFTSDKNWKSALSDLFHSTSIVRTLQQVATKPPLKN